jgi:hypothetical protein
MHAMQYPIRLPADYDMGIIRTRVATRAPQLDGLPGLYLKAYAIQERGVAGASGNQYAPFYVWNTADAMSAFICGPGFRGVCESFGRPVIHHGVAVALCHGPAMREFPHWATRHDELLSEGEVLGEAVGRAREQVDALSRDPALHTCVTSLDPSRWTFTRYSLWTSPPQRDDELLYRVLHLSMPSATEGMRVGAAPTQADRLVPSASGATATVRTPRR